MNLRQWCFPSHLKCTEQACTAEAGMHSLYSNGPNAAADHPTYLPAFSHGIDWSGESQLGQTDLELVLQVPSCYYPGCKVG